MITNRTIVAALAPVIALGLFAGSAAASEVTGTMSSGASSDSVSTSTGSIAATVGPQQAATTTPARAVQPGSGLSGGGAARRAANLAAMGASQQRQITADDIIVYLDGSGPAAAPAGTGGGYDPTLEAELAAIAGEGSAGSVGTGDAVAFNEGLSIEPQVAAVGAEGGVNSGQVWTTVVLGLALLGLAGYAGSSYMAYRRERGY